MIGLLNSKSGIRSESVQFCSGLIVSLIDSAAVSSWLASNGLLHAFLPNIFGKASHTCERPNWWNASAPVANCFGVVPNLRS